MQMCVILFKIYISFWLYYEFNSSILVFANSITFCKFSMPFASCIHLINVSDTLSYSTSSLHAYFAYCEKYT